MTKWQERQVLMQCKMQQCIEECQPLHNERLKLANMNTQQSIDALTGAVVQRYSPEVQHIDDKLVELIRLTQASVLGGAVVELDNEEAK